MTTASVYTGFKLDDYDVGRLFGITQRVGLSILGVKKGEHITLGFRSDPRKLPIELVGQSFCFRVLAIREDQGVQTVMLDPVDGSVRELAWESPPHVTLAHRVGVAPATSKRLARDFLKDGPREGDLTFDDVTITGTLGFLHDRHGWMFHIPDDSEMVATPRK